MLKYEHDFRLFVKIIFVLSRFIENNCKKYFLGEPKLLFLLT